MRKDDIEDGPAKRKGRGGTAKCGHGQPPDHPYRQANNAQWAKFDYARKLAQANHASASLPADTVIAASIARLWFEQVLPILCKCALDRGPRLAKALQERHWHPTYREEPTQWERRQPRGPTSTTAGARPKSAGSPETLRAPRSRSRNKNQQTTRS